MGKDWVEYQSKSGQTLFVYNKETGEHKWPHGLGNGVEYRIMHGRPVEYKELSTTATQTDDNGCNNGCMSMYINTDPSHVTNTSDTRELQLQQRDIPDQPSMCISATPSQVADVSDITTSSQQHPSSVSEGKNLICHEAVPDSYDNVVHFYDYFDHGGNGENLNSSKNFSDEATLHKQQPDIQNEVSNLNNQTLFKSTIKLERRDEQEEDQSSEIATAPQDNFVENSNGDYDNDNNHNENSLRDTNGKDPNHTLYRISTILRNLPEHSDGNQNGEPHQADDFLKQFECSYCTKKFRFKCNLKKHERIHTNVKPFECSYCKKKFTQSSHLNTHLKYHTGERPFECSVCHERFIQKSHLSTHIKTHTGEKYVFECSICKKTFTRKYTMRLHVRIQHNIT